MNGYEVIEKIGDLLDGDELIVSSNGNISRQVYHLLPKPQLYLRGSMGLPLSVGLGLALSQEDTDVIVILGDGNFLMGMSSVTTVAQLSPANLKIIILDNRSYATTGGQRTTSSVIQYEHLFEAFGAKHVRSVDGTGSNIEELLKDTLSAEEMSVLHVNVDVGEKDLSNIPWHPKEIKKRVKRKISCM